MSESKLRSTKWTPEGEASLNLKDKRIAELEQERDAAFNKGMERAAEIIVVDSVHTIAGKYQRMDSDRIRKEIDK